MIDSQKLLKKQENNDSLDCEKLVTDSIELINTKTI